MTKLYRYAICLLFCLGLLSPSWAQIPTRQDPRDSLALLAEQERLRTLDPALGRVPYERLEEARQELLSKQAGVTTPTGPVGAQAGIPNISWQERGPSNAGNSIRAVLFDPNDPTKKKVWVGLPGGGLWMTNDITDATAPWVPTFVDAGVVTTIAADPSNPQIMYVGTGDRYGYIQGRGILKSTNGGATWTALSSTIPGGNYPSITQGFAFIQKIVVNSSGHVFVATRFGVVRSTNGGSTWTLLLAPNQGIGGTPPPSVSIDNDLVTDLEIGSDGILYAAFNPSRLFRSTNTAGTGWTEITPAGSGGLRTELALSSSTNGSGQIIYAVTQSYNSTNFTEDIRWFKKSINGGTSWTDLTIPTRSVGGHFTVGQGNLGLQLLVHPTDPNLIWAGGFNWYRSINGGASWSNELNSRNNPQQGIWLQPGTTGAVLTDYSDIIWSENWTNLAVATPAQLERSSGLRGGVVKSISMKNLPGGMSLMYGVEGKGYQQMTSTGLSAGGNTFWGIYTPGTTFVDENEPELQLFQSGSAFYQRLNSTGQNQFLTNVNSFYSPIAADYDSQSNTLYVADFDYPTSRTFVKKVTGVGTNPVVTIMAPASFNYSVPSVIRVSRDRNSLFLGISTSTTKLFKMTGLDQPTPTVTSVDGGVFSQYTTISSIDIGATDNELLVTLANYGVQSVWYTNNGGATWVSKDAAGYGLPDIPVWSALFNPQNRQQVLLGTELGVWSTSNITATNPGWEYTGGGMGMVRVNQLRHRPADGRVTAATNGRGIFTTDALAVSYTPSVISISALMNSASCPGTTNALVYTASGPVFSSPKSAEVRLSDANGNFTPGTVLTTFMATATSSGVTVVFTIPSSGIATSSNYRLKLSIPSADIESGSGPITLVGAVTVRITDKLTTPSYNRTSSYVCSGDPVKLNAEVTSSATGSAVTGATYQWLLNGAVISGATSQTYLATQAGTYRIQVRSEGCTSSSSPTYNINYFNNSSYNFNITSRFGSLPQCDDTPTTLIADYAGEQGGIRWMQNGVAIAGATSGTLVATQSGNYSYSITYPGCAGVAQPLAVTLGRSLFAQLTISSDSILCNGTSSGSVYMSASNLPYDGPGNGGFEISWFRDGIPTNQYKNQPYSYVSLPGQYTFELKQGTCVAKSNAIVVGTGTITPPNIVPNDYPTRPLSACPGDSRQVYVSGGYTSYNSFQWRRNGVDIVGATTPYYTVQTSGDYTVRVNKGSCTATSAPVSYTFANALNPEIHLYDSPTTRCSNIWLYANQNTSLSGTQYQWLKDGVAISGATGSEYNTNQSGAYSVSVTNGSCMGLSNPLVVNPHTLSKPTITTSSVLNLCGTNSVYLTTRSSNGIQWKRNGLNIPNATSSSFYPTQSGSYTVYEASSCGVAESDPVAVGIGPPSATLSGSTTITAGQSTTLAVSLSGAAPWSFTINGTAYAGVTANPYRIAVSPTTSTTYALTQMVNQCGPVTLNNVSTVVTIGTCTVMYSVRTGGWEDPGTWSCNRLPTVSDVVTITAGHTVTLPASITGFAQRLQQYGRLVYGAGGRLRLGQ